jgi:hypothetical protein
LPGYDAATRTLRITRERNRSRDRHGRSVAFLGRAHPVVRHAISSVRRVVAADCDGRVSAAWANAGSPLSLLLCFRAELHSAHGVELQRIIAVQVLESGAPVEIPDTEQWLQLASTDRGISTAHLWRDLFAPWASARQTAAEAVAMSVLQRMALESGAMRDRAAYGDLADLKRWLRLRADDICGTFIPRTPDLFGVVPIAPMWQTLGAPLDRLTAFAADGSNPPAGRREADSAVALFQRRTRERESRADLSPPMLLPVGMLMMVPPGRDA